VSDSPQRTWRACTASTLGGPRRERTYTRLATKLGTADTTHLLVYSASLCRSIRRSLSPSCRRPRDVFAVRARSGCARTPLIAPRIVGGGGLVDASSSADRGSTSRAPAAVADPRVSVVMAVRNGARTVVEAGRSILDQTFTDLEFIVVDDASTDDTAAMLSELGDPRVRVLTNARQLGLSRSLNAGIAHSSGEFVARQDADDVSEAIRLERQVAFLDRHPRLTLVGSWYTKIDSQGRSLGARPLPTNSTDLRWRLLFHSPFVHASVVLRRAVLDDVGVYDASLRYSLDRDLWCRIALDHAVANLPERLMRYRVSDTSMTSTYGATVEAERWQAGTAYLRALCARAGLSSVPASCLQPVSALLFGGPRLPPAHAVDAINRAAQLHRIFCIAYALPAAEEHAARARLRRRVTRRLVSLAAWEVRGGDVTAARRLVAVAARAWAQL
jgi:hypothetical protein